VERKQINQGIDTMSVMNQARALREVHQPMVLGNLVDAIVSHIRVAFTGAGRAMTLVYGRTGR
jgi:hypothetical protein